MKSLSHILGLDRLNGRFLWGGLTLVICLLFITSYAHIQVRETAKHSLGLIQTTRNLNLALNNVKDTLQKTENAVYRYSTLFDHTQREVIALHLNDLRNQTTEILGRSAIQNNDQYLNEVRKLITATGELHISITDYLLAMRSVESRYPGMPILLQFVEPTNRQFSEAVEQALIESNSAEMQKGRMGAEQYEIRQLFHEIRYAWSQKISWLRVFVGNRIGAFGDPGAAMSQNLANRDIYADTVLDLMRQLEILDKKDKLGLQQSESLVVMKEANKYYEHYVKKAVEIYLSNSWRSDIPILENRIQPSIDAAWVAITQIDNLFKQLSNDALNQSQDTAKALSSAFWVFIGAIMLVLTLAYFLFEKTIRKPVLHMAAAMDAEGRGESVHTVYSGKTREIELLIHAFNGMRDQVNSRQQRLESILKNAAEGIITIDSKGIIESFNTAAQKLFDYSFEDVVGKNVAILAGSIDPDSHDMFMSIYQTHGEFNILGQDREVTGRRRDGTTFPMSLKVSELKLGDRALYTAIVDDISERKAVMEHLRHLAEHDSLTGLYNRQYFMEEMERALENAKRNEAFHYACLYVDLDNFKYINDSIGHLAGDRMLNEVAEILVSRTRKSDILARLGGDEFAILLSNVELEQAHKTADYYREKIQQYIFSYKGRSVDVGASIGVSMLEDDIENKEQLLMRADIACHMAKNLGRNRVYIYNPNDQKKIDAVYADMGWSQRIKDALEHDHFVLHYQPIVSGRDNSIFGYEALVRMYDPRVDSLIMPGGFMSSAERFGLMEQIDIWVVKKALHRLSELQKQYENIRFFINISGQTIGNKLILDTIRDLFTSLSIKPESVVIELAESVAISELSVAVDFLQELNNIGCMTALDDFGVGYSSFAYLKELPVDFVKIDGSFIQGIEHSDLNKALVRAIHDISQTLGKHTIAEFVENQTVLDYLHEMNIDYVQGYHFGRPSEHPEGLGSNVISITRKHKA